MDPFIAIPIEISLVFFIWRVTQPIRDDIRVSRYVRGKRWFA